MPFTIFRVHKYIKNAQSLIKNAPKFELNPAKSAILVSNELRHHFSIRVGRFLKFFNILTLNYLIAQQDLLREQGGTIF